MNRLLLVLVLAMADHNGSHESPVPLRLVAQPAHSGSCWPQCWRRHHLQRNALRIKEVAAVQGVRSNQLTGYGLVVGLDGTGDQTTQMPYTTQAMSNYLQQMGITLPPGTAPQLQLKNVAAGGHRHRPAAARLRSRGRCWT